MRQVRGQRKPGENLEVTRRNRASRLWSIVPLPGSCENERVVGL